MFKDKYDKILIVTEQIRDFINDYEVLEYLIDKNGIEWDLLTASLDTIEDTIEGINSFEIDSDSTWKNYLNIYWVLQCFYVLQDSVKSLIKSFTSYWFIIDDIDFSNSIVRKIRNDIIWHPTTRRNWTKSLIIRATISYNHLKYIMRDSNWNSTYDNIFEYSYINDELESIKKFLDYLSKTIIQQKVKITVF